MFNVLGVQQKTKSPKIELLVSFVVLAGVEPPFFYFFLSNDAQTFCVSLFLTEISVCFLVLQLLLGNMRSSYKIPSQV